jgi:asparagine synthase (glutamine-hydrolysing)
MLDHNFVEWALGLPHAMKIANGHGKFVLKRALERFLPNDLLYRPKQGFSVPLARWFRGDLGKRFREDVRGKNGLVASGYFDGRVIERLTLQHQSGLHDHSRSLWLLWMFQRFLLEVHDAPSAAAHARA